MGSRPPTPCNSSSPPPTTASPWRPSRWRRTTPATGLMSARSSARPPGSEPRRLGRGGRAYDQGQAAGDRAGPDHREAGHCHPPTGGEGEAAGRQRAGDERSERAKKVFQSKADEDEKRITALEKELKEAREKAEAADATYDDVAKKLATCEGDLEKAEERADVGEDKIIELEEELRVVANNLKSLEVAEEKANQREKTN